MCLDRLYIRLTLLKVADHWQSLLEQCCHILDMHDLLHGDLSRLCTLCAGTEFLTDTQPLIMSWTDMEGPALVKLASQADVRLMLQLLICSQVSPQTHSQQSMISTARCCWLCHVPFLPFLLGGFMLHPTARASPSLLICIG